MNEEIKEYIDTYVKENGNEEITGAILNLTLNKMVSQLYAHRCCGVITPYLPLLYGTDIPAWGIASQNGTYTNYGDIEVEDELALIVYDGTTFTKQTIISKSWINGPASSTVGYVAVADDTSGKSIKYVPVTVDDSGNVVIPGNATINGTLTTINLETLTLQVKDKIIEIAKVDTPTDDTADGGGITLLGATNKTITWVKSKLSWVFNQAVEIAGDLNVIGTIKTNGTQISTSDLSDGSDLVKGPSSATDNTLPRFDLTTGKLLKAGGSITNLDNGNVGIANNNPTEKLHVIGNIRSSAEVHAGTKVVIASKVEQVYDSVNQSLKFNFL